MTVYLIKRDDGKIFSHNAIVNELEETTADLDYGMLSPHFNKLHEDLHYVRSLIDDMPAMMRKRYSIIKLDYVLKISEVD